MKTKKLIAAAMLLGGAMTSFGQTTSTPNLTTHGNETGQVTNESVHIGRGAGQHATSGTEGPFGRNTYVGQYAGQGVSGTSTGRFNVFIGYKSGWINTTGSANVFLGYMSGAGNSSGINNTFIGYTSGEDNTSGIDNTFFGVNTGQHNVIGSGNTYIGRLAGQNSTGSKNVFLGYGAGQAETGSNKLYITNSETVNPLIYGEFRASGMSAQPGVLKFNAQKVGIGYNSDGAFGPFPPLTFSNANTYRLFVRGGILAYEVRVRVEAGWADYVFAKDYKLMPLAETEKYISENGHLPNMPSAAEVAADGIEMGNMAKLQQEKIEELTLHVIELNKQVELLKAQNEELEDLKTKVDQLLNKQ